MARMFFVLMFAALVATGGAVAPVSARPAVDGIHQTGDADERPRPDTPGNGAAIAEFQRSITHSASMAVVWPTSVACLNSGYAVENKYLRVFDLPAFGIGDYYTVSSIDLGIQDSYPAGATQPIYVNLYTLDGPLLYENMTKIGAARADVGYMMDSVINIPVTGVAPRGAKLVVEIDSPNREDQGNSFWIGANEFGQTGKSYVAAPACSLPEPTDLAAVGFPNVSFVLRVNGDERDPLAIERLCASYYTGAVSVQHPVNGCPATALPMTMPQAVKFCVNTYTGALTWSARGTCAGYGMRQHILPDHGQLGVCWNSWSGGLRAARSALTCSAAEIYGYIPADR